MKMKGFIKLYRQITDWEWYSDPVVRSVFIHLLLTTNINEKVYKGTALKTGQTVTGYHDLANKLGFTVQQIRTAFKKLQLTNEITIRSTSVGTVVTIVNWEKFQSQQEKSTNGLTNASTSNQQLYKKNKNITTDLPGANQCWTEEELLHIAELRR